jgi:hypothetical protein
MSPEDRSAARAARLREKAESDARYQKVIDRQEALARSRGFKNFDEMEAFNSEDLLKEGKITPDALRPMIGSALEQAIASHPTLAKAAQVIDQASVNEDVRAFAAKFPGEKITSVDDFVGKPWYPSFSKYVGMGLNYVEAYKLANDADLTQRAAGAATQRALNSMAGTAHLQPVGGGADDLAVTIDAETMRWYRGMHPTWTDKQIHERYQKSMKG